MMNGILMNLIVDEMKKTHAYHEDKLKKITSYNDLSILWERYANLVEKSDIPNKDYLVKQAFQNAAKNVKKLIEIAAEDLNKDSDQNG